MKENDKVMKKSQQRLKVITLFDHCIIYRIIMPPEICDVKLIQLTRSYQLEGMPATADVD